MPQHLPTHATLRKELFIDDRFIDEMSDLERCFHQANKYQENPVICADQPWEKDAAFVDAGLVLYDETDNLFKAWYQGGACYGPDDGSNMCYATSTNGVKWDKPALGVTEYEGSTNNNIVLQARGMMHDPAPILDWMDPDPQRRFKAIWWGAREDSSQKSGWMEGHCVGFSPDGIRWHEHPDNPVWPGEAEVAIPFGVEHAAGRLVTYCSADGYGCRVVARTQSDDFVNWDRPPELTFQSDPDDPPGTEYGGLCGINYEGTFIGMLWVIHNQPEISRDTWKSIIDRNLQQGFFGPPITMNATGPRVMTTELVTSLDGVNWKRLHRVPFIPYGPARSWDECLILAGRPIVVNDQIYIYYTGQGRTKKFLDLGYDTESVREWNIDTGLATLRLDGFASLQAGSTPGILVTKSLLFEGSQCTLNIYSPSGSVKVEVLDETGNPLEGFTVDQSEPVTGDQLRAQLTWRTKSNMQELTGFRIKLKLYLEEAQLYSISILK